MARMNISIPDTTHSQLGEFPDVIWSRVAASAFDAELLRLRTEAQKIKNAPLLERMRAERDLLTATKDQRKTAAYKKGLVDGRLYATTEATYAELHYLADEYGTTQMDELFADAGLSEDAHHLRIGLYCIMQGRDDIEDPHVQLEAHEFFSLKNGKPDNNIERIQGFVDGCVEAFEEIEKQL